MNVPIDYLLIAPRPEDEGAPWVVHIRWAKGLAWWGRFSHEADAHAFGLAVRAAGLPEDIDEADDAIHEHLYDLIPRMVERLSEGLRGA